MGASERESGKIVSVGPGGNIDLDNLFTYHPPTEDQVLIYEALREMGKTFATLIGQVCPSSPDRTRAINHVRDAVMVANASIATYAPGWPPPEPESATDE